jgi:hypothetical protein
MATFQKYQNGVTVLVTTANASTDGFKLALTNTAPVAATHTVLAQDATVTLTAAGGAIGPFRYVVFYDDTVAGDPLLSFYDYLSSITLNDTETFAMGAASTLFTVT